MKKATVKLDTAMQAAIEKYGMQFGEYELKAFQQGKKSHEFTMKTMKEIGFDKDASIPGGLSREEYEQGIISGMQDSIGHAGIVIIQGVVDTWTDNDPASPCALNFFGASTLTGTLDTARENLPEMVMYIVQQDLGIKHKIMQMTTTAAGDFMNFGNIYATVSIYAVMGDMPRVLHSGVHVSLTKDGGECIICAGPRNVKYVTFPPQALVPYLNAVDADGHAPLFGDADREWTLARALAGLESRTRGMN